jgi:hypothetical protein
MTKSNHLQIVRDAVAALPAWRAVFVKTIGGYSLHNAIMIKLVATAYGNTPISWESATIAVLSGPDKFANIEETGSYLKHLCFEMECGLASFVK